MTSVLSQDMKSPLHSRAEFFSSLIEEEINGLFFHSFCNFGYYYDHSVVLVQINSLNLVRLHKSGVHQNFFCYA